MYFVINFILPTLYVIIYTTHEQCGESVVYTEMSKYFM